MNIACRLEKKAALVTGGSRGIGRAVALRFAAEGAVVAINHYRDDEAAAATLRALRETSDQRGGGAKAHVAIDADVANAGAVRDMVASAVAALGDLHILVNNAGIQEPTPADAFSDDVFARVLAVNLIGVAYCCRAALRHFTARPGGGVIINTTSVHERIPKPDYLAYSISKGGVGNLTRTLALEFSGHGVRVNSVAPGAVVTDMNAAWADDARARAAVERHIPMGRAASPDEIAPVFAFLASDEASYITGQTIYACGGLTLYGDFKENWSS